MRNARRAPATFSLEQIVRLFAIACSKPEVYERPISHWTVRELAAGWSWRGGIAPPRMITLLTPSTAMIGYP